MDNSHCDWTLDPADVPLLLFSCSLIPDKWDIKPSLVSCLDKCDISVGWGELSSRLMNWFLLIIMVPGCGELQTGDVFWGLRGELPLERSISLRTEGCTGVLLGVWGWLDIFMWMGCGRLPTKCVCRANMAFWYGSCCRNCRIGCWLTRTGTCKQTKMYLDRMKHLVF